MQFAEAARRAALALSQGGASGGDLERAREILLLPQDTAGAAQVARRMGEAARARAESSLKLEQVYFARSGASWLTGIDICVSLSGVGVMASFARCVGGIRQLLATPSGQDLRAGRLKNQADFYSLFGAVSALEGEIDWAAVANRLNAFILDVSDEARRAASEAASRYFEAARSASNDAGPRKLRIEILLRVMRPPV